MINGKHAFVCTRCGRVFVGSPQVVTKTSRKNKRGRIAWTRDGICLECTKKEEKNNDKKSTHNAETESGKNEADD